MQKAARYALLLMFATLIGSSLLQSGIHPVRVLLIVSGLSLFVGGMNAIGFRGRRRRGKEEGLVAGAPDLLALTWRDWAELSCIMLLSFALVVGGLVVHGDRA